MKKLKLVLLVDDDEVTNFINSELIEEMGIAEKVEFCGNGKEAMDFLERMNPLIDDINMPELILIDINMPEMDGFEFLEAYSHKYENHVHTIVIAMLTTSLRQEDIARAGKYKNLVNEYLEKPLTKSAIENLVNQFFSK
jgi:CheY-like chemotaxis protein